jgi:hypothetical protein
MSGLSLGGFMLYMTRYSIRGERTKERIGTLMSAFAERGEIPGTVAHYTAVDGTGGLLIIDSDDVATLYQATLAYQEWLEMEVTPIMTIDDAVPHILASLG